MRNAKTDRGYCPMGMDAEGAASLCSIAHDPEFLYSTMNRFRSSTVNQQVLESMRCERILHLLRDTYESIIFDSCHEQDGAALVYSYPV